MNHPDPSQRAFDSHAEDYESQLMQGLRLSGESKEFYARGRLAYLRRFLRTTQRPEPRGIIDYGCGVGDVTALIAELFEGAEVLGLDPSGRCIERARRDHAGPRVSFAVMQGFGSAIGGTADIVYTNGVVHHVPREQRTQLFAAISRLVAPGGLVAVFENNPWNPGTRMVMSRIPFDLGVRPVSPRETRRRLVSASLTPLETGYLFYFPRRLRLLRPLEPLLLRIPLGAQYAVMASHRP